LFLELSSQVLIARLLDSALCHARSVSQLSIIVAV
jgi:hypothetical protein